MHIDCRFSLVLIRIQEFFRVRKAQDAFVLFCHSGDCSQIFRATESKIYTMFCTHKIEQEILSRDHVESKISESASDVFDKVYK